MSTERVPTRLGPLPRDWRVMPLGTVTERTALPIDVAAGELYREIGIRSHGKGVFHKDAVKGETLGAKRVFRVVPERLVFNIVFAWEGAVAVTSTSEEGMIASHRFPMFGPSPERLVDVEFLRRFFQSEIGVRLLGEASPGGAGRNRTLNQKFTSEIPVPLPPLGEQKKIAAALASVDEAIEATQAVVDQLRFVKKAMMAELLTRGLPGRHTQFKHTEIGQIPEDWEVGPIADFLREPMRNGYSPVCPSTPTGRWVLHLGAVTFDGFNPSALKPAPLNDARIDGALVKTGDLLMSRSNTRERVGLVGLYRGVPESCAFPDLMMRLRTSERLLPEFLEAVLLSGRARSYLSAAARGTSESMVKINRDIVGAFRIQIPTLEEQRRLVEVAASITARCESEQRTIEGLRTVKRALMSVLLTGEVRVKPDPEPA